MERFERGQRVQLTHGQTSTNAVVVLVSENGVSLALTFDGMFAGHVGRMAVLRHPDGYRSVIGNQPVGVVGHAAR